MPHASLPQPPDRLGKPENASDQGAFSFLQGVAPDKLRRRIQGYEFRVTSLRARQRRDIWQWNGPFLMTLHREVFGPLFPKLAGNFRINEANFGRRAGAAPEHLPSLLEQLVLRFRDHLLEVRAMQIPEEQLDSIFVFAALDHAEMLRIHPFADGNGRWARIVTVMFLVDCGLPVAAILRKRDKVKYIAAADRCIDDSEPGDLANLFMQGYVDMLKARRLRRFEPPQH
jgi:fido (protein-threonine AMPylation protein)